MTTTKVCRVDGCDKPPPPSSQTTLCSMHANRLRRHGDFDTVKSPPGDGWTSINGYAQEPALGHPLRRPDRVAKGRIVLFDKIGPGEHPCHWCHEPIAWDDDTRPLKAVRLDEDRTNDDPANLVPGCRGCILRRTTARRWGKEFSA